MYNAYAVEVIGRLRRRYGKVHTGLMHSNTTELFVAALLSPQCTDIQVNKTTLQLFRRRRGFMYYAKADPAELRRALKGVNYYKTKARNLKASSQIICERFDGRLPRTLHGLMELPGVGRKVANVILNEGFGIAEGIAVDTHCARVSGRLGLSRHRDPLRIEQDLMRKIPKRHWIVASDLFIELGRDTCKAQRKECYRCVLNDICVSSDVKNHSASMLSSG